jgi:2-keto-4-pentenoate hydratase
VSEAPSGAKVQPEAVAAAFVRARRDARALATFPGGVLPPDLASAYRIQDLAIGCWPEALAGWKVGWIAPDRREPGGDDRLVGPIFAGALWPQALGAPQEVPVFAGGFAAVEAEYVFRLGADAPADRLHWSPADALALVAALHIGIETAGSPLATINQLGPTAVVSDFGNNAGLVLGPEIPDWQRRDDASLHCETFVDRPGQWARISFDATGDLCCRAVAATGEPRP